jgi:hypothetical protein
LINIRRVNPTLTLTDLILTVLVALLLGYLLGDWARRSKNATPALPKEGAVSARAILGAHERRMYKHLQNAFPRRLIVPKLALVRFCQPNDVSKVRYWYTLLGSSHVTFAVCDADGRVLLAIDLEGDRPRSRRSLEVRQSVLNACGIKHLRVTTQQLPDMSELRSVLPSGAIADGGNASQELHPTPMLNAAWTTLATTVAVRRAQRKPKWQESSLFQDSFFSSGVVPDRAAELISRPASRDAPTASAATGTPDALKVGSSDLPLTMGR